MTVRPLPHVTFQKCMFHWKFHWNSSHFSGDMNIFLLNFKDFGNFFGFSNIKLKVLFKSYKSKVLLTLNKFFLKYEGRESWSSWPSPPRKKLSSKRPYRLSTNLESLRDGIATKFPMWTSHQLPSAFKCVLK